MIEFGVEKYLARYAEPEAALAARLSGRYSAAVVVPALAESLELLEGLRPAARAAASRALLVLVINASPSTRVEEHIANAELLAALEALDSGCERISANVLLVRDPDLDLLVVDRASPGSMLPAKQGVGLSRKLGMDLVLGLCARDQLATPWIFSTDADVRLPSEYFRPRVSRASSASALLFPFRHDGQAGPTHAATLRYEMSLRYHVLGLASAGSPYAYHSLGSTLAICPRAYAAVRGVPRRTAGEDFYLLDKLAKVAPLERLECDPILIRARRSERVPFGTGPRVRQILEQGEMYVLHPRVYALLAGILQNLEGWANAADPSFAGRAGVLTDREAQVARATLEHLGTFSACRNAAAAVGTGSLRRRLHTWFDALRTLRLLHGLRDAELLDLPLETALGTAPFTPLLPAFDACSALDQLRELERRLPRNVGPSLL